MARYVKLPIPPGSKSRPEIEFTLTNYEVKNDFGEKAKEEYFDLLSKENKFSVEDPNNYKSVCRKVEQLPNIRSYTVYGEGLQEKYRDSNLIRFICIAYYNFHQENEQVSMRQFAQLKEVSNAYDSLKKKKSQGLSQTVHGKAQNTTGLSQPYSQSVNPKHMVHGSHQQASSQGQIFLYDDQPNMIDGRKFYPESMYQQLQQHAKAQEKDINDLQNELKEQKQEIDELRNRLSGFASRQLTEGNPDFTDLSDKNRPTVIAERFHSVYDDEWTSCLETLTHAKKGSIALSEEEAISLLMDIIKRCFIFCTNYTAKQKDMVTDAWKLSLQNPFSMADGITRPVSSVEVPEIVTNELKKRRRQKYDDCITNACRHFKENVLKADSKFKSKMVPAVETYADKCVEIIWLMSVQDPPMHLCWPEEKDDFKSELYKEYGKKGKVVKLAVWPAVMLHKNGAIMYKGFAMPV